ncbi:MAG: hypothetical protein HDS24_05690 [Bacteroides sp.]|nr:hypothetical protein [Bacteroides sp.]
MSLFSKIINPLNHGEDLKRVAELYEKKRERFLELIDSATNDAIVLFNLREKSYQLISALSTYVNNLAHCPNSIINGVATALSLVSVIKTAIDKDKSIRREYNIETQSGALLGAATVGGAVAVGGSTAAIAVATTFGTASTGTAISALGGAAATNAALAWLGGGAIAAGGSGIAGGTALLSLLGPIGWGIAGVSAISFLGVSLTKGSKNKKTIDALNAECNKIDQEIYKLENARQRVKKISAETKCLIPPLQKFIDDSNTTENTRDYNCSDYNQEGLFDIVHKAKTLGKLSRESANL